MKLLIRNIKSWWFRWLLIGVAIRLLLMPITLHPDLWGHSFTVYFFAYEGQLNIYDYLASLPQSHPLVRNFGVTDIFIYPPLTYFTLGVFRILVKPFADPNFIPWLMGNLGQLHSYPKLMEQIFLFKFPYLFVDVAVAFFLSGLFSEQRKKKLAFIFWMFNPVTLYATFMIGQLDILPVFFVVLSLFFIKQKRISWALISLGIAGSYKMFPLLFILPTAFVLGTTLKERVKLIFLGFLPFILPITPYLTSEAFRGMVLFQPKSQKMLFMNFPVSGAEGLYPFILGLVVIYLFAYYSKRFFSPVYYYLAIMLLTFSVTHYHPQWFLWVTPLLIWELVNSNFKNKLLVSILFVSWLVITLFFESSLSYGLFNPLWPRLDNAQSLSEILNKYTNVFQLKSLTRSVFAGVSAYLVYQLFNSKRYNA